MERKRLSLLIVLILIVSVLSIYLSRVDLTLTFKDLTVDPTFELTVSNKLILEESYRFNVNRNNKYRMLYRVWEVPLSVKETLNRPHILVNRVFGEGHWYVKDYRGRVTGKLNKRALLLVKKLSERNEVGLLNLNRFKAGSYYLRATYTLFPPIEYFRGQSLVKLNFASRHVPYGDVVLKVYDPLGKVLDLYPLFPYRSIKKEGNTFLIEGSCPENTILTLSLLIEGKVLGWLKLTPSLGENFSSSKKLPHIFHNLWNLLTLTLKLFLLTVPPFLIFLYLKFGKERSFTVPSFLSFVPNPKRPPWLVNLVFNGDAFYADENAFYSTLLDLSRKGVLELRDGRVILKNPPKEGYEKELYSFLERYSIKEGNLRVFDPSYLKALAKRWKLYSNLDGLRALKEEVDRLFNYEAPYLSSQFVDRKGWIILSRLAFVSLFLSGFFVLILVFKGRVLFYTFDLYQPTVLSLGLTACFLLALLFPSQLFGRWRDNYYLEKLQWEAFKRFLGNIAAIKRYAPEDISIWKEWLVYGTALGVGDGVEKALREFKVEIPEVREIGKVRSSFNISLNTIESSLSSLEGSKGTSGGGFGGGGAGGR